MKKVHKQDVGVQRAKATAPTSKKPKILPLVKNLRDDYGRAIATKIASGQAALRELQEAARPAGLTVRDVEILADKLAVARVAQTSAPNSPAQRKGKRGEAAKAIAAREHPEKGQTMNLREATDYLAARLHRWTSPKKLVGLATERKIDSYHPNRSDIWVFWQLDLDKLVGDNKRDWKREGGSAVSPLPCDGADRARRND